MGEIEDKTINKNDMSSIGLINDHLRDRPENSFDKQLQHISNGTDSNNEYEQINRVSLNRNSELSIYPRQ